MKPKLPSSAVVFVLACSFIASAAHAQPRGDQPQQQSSAHNFYITTPQTGESVAAGNQTSQQQTYNTYTATTAWQPSAAQTQTRQRSSARSSRASASASSSAQQQTYNTYNNYYTQAAGQQTAQQTTYPSYVAHASAHSTSQQKQGLFSRLLHRNHNHQKPQVTQVSNNALKRSRYSGTVQSGVASWYGSDWHGKKTANGERYNMESMTAAHRTLPFGTMVKVKNERNGRECVVRINNRGPFTKGRILDLSKAAARQLGMVGSGVAKVKVEVLGKS